MNIEALRKARKKKFNSAQEFANKLGVNRITVSHWENGKFEPSTDTLHRIADILDVSVEYLMGEEETPRKQDVQFMLLPYVSLFDHVRGEIGNMDRYHRQKAFDMVESATETLWQAWNPLMPLDDIRKIIDTETRKKWKVIPPPKQSAVDENYLPKLTPYAAILDSARKDIKIATFENFKEALDILLDILAELTRKGDITFPPYKSDLLL